MPLKIVEDFQVGASSGQDSIHDGITAGLVGTLLVVLIMIGYYRGAGVLAVAALGALRPVHAGGPRRIEATLTCRASPAWCCRSASRWTPTC